VKIVPEALFYNPAIPKVASLTKEWVQFRSPSFNANVFNYCSYPFLIHEYHKLQLLQFDFKSTQEVQVTSILLTVGCSSRCVGSCSLLNIGGCIPSRLSDRRPYP
jgi:hypothetical protein